jgi:integrase
MRLPKWCTINLDRRGRPRVRFRRRGVSLYLSGMPWSEPFMRQYAAALALQAPPVGAERTTPGSFSALVVAYYASTEFKRLAPATQRQRRSVLERLRTITTTPLHGLERRHIEALMGARTPEAANVLLKTLRTMFEFAVRVGMLDANPTLGVRRARVRSDGWHAWSEEEIAQYEAHHPLGSKARLALALLLYTAQRRQDVVKLGWQHVRGNSIALRQAKTGRSLLVPIAPALAEALASVPRGNLTFLTDQYGKAYTSDALGHTFRRWCRAAGLPEACRAHGLRKAAARRLAEAGCTVHEIAAVTGHASLKEVAHYTRAVDQEQLAERAMNKLGTRFVRPKGVGQK